MMMELLQMRKLLLQLLLLLMCSAAVCLYGPSPRSARSLICPRKLASGGSSDVRFNRSADRGAAATEHSEHLVSSLLLVLALALVAMRVDAMVCVRVKRVVRCKDEQGRSRSG